MWPMDDGEPALRRHRAGEGGAVTRTDKDHLSTYLLRRMRDTLAGDPRADSTPYLLDHKDVRYLVRLVQRDMATGRATTTEGER
jgi:hypothetical protein